MDFSCFKSLKCFWPHYNKCLFLNPNTVALYCFIEDCFVVEFVKACVKRAFPGLKRKDVWFLVTTRWQCCTLNVSERRSAALMIHSGSRLYLMSLGLGPYQGRILYSQIAQLYDAMKTKKVQLLAS